MKTISLCLGVAILSALPVTAFAAPPQRVAVLGLEARGVDASATETLTALVGTEVARLGQVDVVAQDDVRGLVAATTLAQVLGCQGVECGAGLGSIGERLNAGWLITGTVGTLGQKTVLNLSLLDARSGRVERRADAQGDTLEETGARVRGAVLALFGIAGQLVLWNQTDGAQVFLNEKLVGTTPLGKLDLPREGEYTVRVYRDDSTPFETTVKVQAGEVARVKIESHTFVDLDARATSRRRLGAGLLAGGVVALAGGGVLQALAVRSDARLDGLDLRKPEDVAAGQAIADTTFNYVAGATAAAVVGLGVAITGTWLLVDNPWQEELDRYAIAPTDGGAMLVATARW